MLHALWIEWRADLQRTTALFTLAGVDKQQVQPDPHVDFDDLFTPAAPVRQDREERRRVIAQLMAG
ncbi:hypothetical protein [Streptosporangium sp. NPDC049078]|uniref:hypothetical protein n=1 Tax=Streptosporangium sp. NPDC049078 TaxID=3155767 RepID=UPI00343A705B